MRERKTCVIEDYGDKKCKMRKQNARCANMCILLNVLGLPDQPGRGEIGKGVQAPGTRVLARGQVDSGSERELKS